MTDKEFRRQITAGISKSLPPAKAYEPAIQSELKDLYSTIGQTSFSGRSDDLKLKEQDIILKYMKLPVEELCDEYKYEGKIEVMNSLSSVLVYMLKGFEEAEKGTL